MESGVEKKHKLTKRRAINKQIVDEGESCDEVNESVRLGKDKTRTKPRRRKNNANLFDEDIIDGFAIISFKSFEDLENAVKSAVNLKPGDNKGNNSGKPRVKKKIKKTCSPPSPHLPRLSDSSPVGSPSSDQTEDLSDTPTHSHTRERRLSEASFQSSSGRGYECDSESGDERASDASSDIFSTVNHNRECLAPSTTSCSSPCPTPVASSLATSVNNADPIDTVSTATSTCTTATATVPTPSTTIATSASIATTSVSSVTTKVPLPTATTSSCGVRTPVTPPVTRSPTLSSGGGRPSSLSRPASNTPIHKDQRKFSPTPIKRREDYLNREREYQREYHREKEREYQREKEFTLPPNIQFSKPWPSSNASGHIFHPHSPGLSPFSSLHSTPPNHHPSSFPSLNPTPLHPTQHPGTHSMFAAPLPPGAAPSASLTSHHTLSGGGLTNNPANAADSMSIASQEILREELNRRFLDAQGRSPLSSLTPTPYLRQDIHQHQHMHQHQHQHTHQHMYPIPPPFTPGSLIPSPAPHMFEKIPKPFESPFYPRAGPSLPGYPTVSPLLHPTTPGHISSGVAGAFQPKGVASSLHPSAVMFASLHGDREKLPLGTSTNTPLPTHKKSGKWCAMHVKIAWEIHQHQQKQSEVGKEGMTSGHLFPGNSLRRPTDITSSSSFLGSHSSSSGSLLDSSNSHPGANQLNLPSFPRPSPYSNIGSFGGLGGSPFASSSGRDVPRIPGITPPHEWNRIHRTPPTFPPSSTWSRPDDREKENLLALERRREEERERERRSGERHRSLDERAREHEGAYHSENRHSLSRSRSRSPLVNGRVGSAKSDGSYDKPGLKIKEERREDDPLDRDKMRNDYLLGSSSMANPLSATLIERARMLSGSSYPLTTDRVPAHSALWNSVDRLQFQQDMERERERMLSRFQTPLSIYEQDRLRKEDLLLQEERLRYLERFPMFERERLSLDPRGLPPSMRHHEHLGPGHFPRTVSPMLNHTKGGSPVCAPGAPPPLIPSTSRSHSNSPAVGKQKMSNESDKTFSNSTDQDSHPR